jgi:hypothetical protein
VADVFHALLGVLSGAHEDVPSLSVQEQALGKNAWERTTGRSCRCGRAHVFDEVRVVLHIEEHLHPKIGRAVVEPHVGVAVACVAVVSGNGESEEMPAGALEAHRESSASARVRGESMAWEAGGEGRMCTDEDIVTMLTALLYTQPTN